MPSLLDLQKNAVIDAIKNIEPPNTWRCCVVDEMAHRLLMNVMDEHTILAEKVSDIKKLDDRRPPQDLECIYILSPDEYSIKCLISDFERPRPRYRCAHLLWTSELSDRNRQLLMNSRVNQFRASEDLILSIDFFSRESHLFTLREPTSFFNFFHPECLGLVTTHIRDVSRKIVSVCVTLGEYPTIRYHKPGPTQLHQARTLSEILAKRVQDSLDEYAQRHHDFPAQSNRPRGVLYICDRSMDLYAPFLHEFTYQAMAHDLLNINDGEKVTYNVEITTSSGETEKKEMVINDEDQVWVANRHQHMKDTIERLMADFQKFLGENKNFVDSNSSTSLYAIRDMMASLPQFQGQKDMYSLHLTMAQECMNLFQQRKLPDVALLEQALATGLDENGKLPREAGATLVRLLDDSAVGQPDRIRLVALYMLYKDGLLEGDIQKLRQHAQLARFDERVFRSLDKLGARVTKPLKDQTPNRNKTQRKKPTQPEDGDDGSDFSRYSTAVKEMLEDHAKGTLDVQQFPYIKPELAPGPGTVEAGPLASLRSAKPTWAKARTSTIEPRQRVIVFMAGGTTFSEARACYEISKTSPREIFLGSSHMLTPNEWLNQLSYLQDSREKLGLPLDMPPKEVPKHLLEPDPVPKPKPPPPQQQAPRPAPAPAPAPAPTPMTAQQVKANQPYWKIDAQKKKDSSSMRRMFGLKK